MVGLLHRFNAIDSRCGMALDAIDPAQWALLEAATDEYVQQEDLRLDEVCQLLLKGLGPLPNSGLQHIRCGMWSAAGPLGLHARIKVCISMHTVLQVAGVRASEGQSRGQGWGGQG